MTATLTRRVAIALALVTGLVLSVVAAAVLPLRADAAPAGVDRAERRAAPVVEFRDRLLGTWRSATPTEFPVGAETVHLVTTVSFDEQREWLTFVAYTDRELTRPLLQYDSEGVYVLRQPSATLPGTYDIDLTNEQQYVTLLQDRPDIVEQVGLADCEPVVGEPFDTSNGCWREILTVSTCIDHDLVSVRGGRLRFGGPGTNRCVTRPTSLATAGLVRVADWR